jgi:3-phenylpropionate/trans-cinnamate dioxygenase ferredoxin reductase subunit
MASQPVFDVLIVGGGVAAGACASTLRDEGYAGSVAVVCAEPHPPYTRPGLSKQVLRGEKSPLAALWRDAAWYADNDVELRSGVTVAALDPAGHAVELADGSRIGYSSLVLATGAVPRHLPLGPAGDPRFHVLRTFADADVIRPHLGPGTRWLVVGVG